MLTDTSSPVSGTASSVCAIHPSIQLQWTDGSQWDLDGRPLFLFPKSDTAFKKIINDLN